ncbi:hypothetical protein [Actinomadura rudentiformis]|uniref:Uncharacterized protein n=1 Tax=Actinomadura rudentiformis TaxID=359158 RepID=A0A6H9YPF1_9ACTN|nr:hypothetical protein [Actinomadura rudentiformis]KAB2343351.1 hypothetical protein F8566_35035 [Actinomadura rudentiformis]
MLISVGILTGCGSIWDDEEACALSDPDCSTWTPTPGTSAPASEAPSTGPSDRLLLQWRMTGGFAGLGGPGSIPEFSLYADGRAYAMRRGDVDSPVDSLAEFQLRPDALTRLLRDARAAGLERSRTAGAEDVADAQILEITMGSARTRVSQPESQATDPAVRMWKRLQPYAWPTADQEASPRPYLPLQVAVLAGETTSSGKTIKPWPLAPLGKGERAARGICTVFTHLDSVTARDLAQSNVVWASQGKTYSVRLRPMLPNEHTCKDIART